MYKRQGQKVNLSKEHAGLAKVIVGLGWDEAKPSGGGGLDVYKRQREDILIPSSCLNSTVSGLISRTFLRDDIIGRDDFHGAVYYGELTDSDLSYDFIETIEKRCV